MYVRGDGILYLGQWALPQSYIRHIFPTVCCPQVLTTPLLADGARTLEGNSYMWL